MKGGDLSEEFSKAELKYKSYIKKSTVYDLHYKPINIRNQKGKKLAFSNFKNNIIIKGQD